MYWTIFRVNNTFVLDCEFDLLRGYYVIFRANILGNGMIPPNPPTSYGLDNTVEHRLLNTSEFDKKKSSKKCLEQMIEVRTHESSRWKRNACEWLPMQIEHTAEQHQLPLFQFSHKSVVEHNLGRNYARQLRFHGTTTILLYDGFDIK